MEHPSLQEPPRVSLLAALLVCKREKLGLFGLQDAGIRTICLVWCFFN